jgi:hypothetical protein
MGWGYGVNTEGREVGYSVEATCDLDGCDAVIDRGLGYCCGGMHDGGKHGCGRYFCGEHLTMGIPLPEQMCDECAERFESDPEQVAQAVADLNRKRANDDRFCGEYVYDRGSGDIAYVGGLSSAR